MKHRHATARDSKVRVGIEADKAIRNSVAAVA
jgi:hypothetical protein